MHGLLVVSDVHLCRLRPNMVRGGQHEFAGFLEHHTALRPGGRPWRLVINGDLFDFDYQAEGLADRGPEAASLALFGAVADEFADVFRALGRFLDAGHEVVVIPGNHDIDLHWPSVRAAFRARVATACERRRSDERLTFRDWFHYEPGRIFIEHGHRFDPDSHVAGLLAPFDAAGQMRSCLATHWIAGFCHRIPELAYHVDHTLSPLSYVPMLLRRYGARAPVLWVQYLAFALGTLRLAGRRQSTPDPRHERALQALASEPGLSKVTVDALECAAAQPRLSSRGATAARLHVVPALLLPVAVVLATIAALAGSRPLGIAAATLVLVVIATNVLVSGRYQGFAEENLRQGARAVQRILGVPLVALGHVHVTTNEPAGSGRYLNSGTWMLSERPLSYLQIDEAGATVRGWEPQEPESCNPHGIQW